MCETSDQIEKHLKKFISYIYTAKDQNFSNEFYETFQNLSMIAEYWPWVDQELVAATLKKAQKFDL